MILKFLFKIYLGEKEKSEGNAQTNGRSVLSSISHPKEECKGVGRRS